MSRYPEDKAPVCPLCKTNHLRQRGARVCAECNRRPGWHLESEAPLAPIEPGPLVTIFDEQWERFNKAIGRHDATVARGPAPGRRDILHLADLHVPFLREDAFLRAVGSNRDCRVCVLGGDALNAGSVSRFIERPAEHVSLRDEMAQLTGVLQLLSETFEAVHVNVGNHPDRVRKYFATRVGPDLMFLVETNPLKFIVDGLARERGTSNIHLAGPLIDDLEASAWGVFVGDALFAHAETHSKVAGRPVENLARWLRRWQRKLPTMPRVICQEHNHTGSRRYDDEFSALLIHTPALSRDVNYQVEARIAYGPNQLGYTRVVLNEDGRADLNASNYHLDFEAMGVAA